MKAQRLKRVALDAGAAGVGICSVEPFDETAASLRQRRDSGLAAGLGFTFSRPDISTAVQTSFTWARSLVVVAHSYVPQAGHPGAADPGYGRVARFAATDQYLPLQTVLQRVAAELTSGGFAAELLVDDSRLVDRAAAVRAGVGWWGKNTMVLVPGTGPWVLLGSVVTDAVIDVDEPMRRDCGTCSACLPACPTGALVEPGVLDARLCLAYWMQAPGAIPRELRPLMGNRVYGCDDCLEACPPGGRSLRSSHAIRGRVDLVTLLSVDDATIIRRFGHHYIPSRNPRYVRRNALVALGNSGGHHAEETAIAYLGHPDPLLRLHSAWAVGRLGGPFAVAALVAAVADERDEAVRVEIDKTLLGM